MCVFCKVAAGQAAARVAYETDELLAFHDTNPQAPTHLLVIPRKHIGALSDVEPADEALLGKLMLAVVHLAETFGLQDGYRVIVNNGAAAGQSVQHLHIHLLAGRRLRWPPG
jgi:histidine triad (HIT) family protein